MRKSIKLVLKTLAGIAVLVLGLTACGNNAGNAKTDSLYAQGLEIVQLMSEMTRHEECIDFYTGNSEIMSVVHNLSLGDYTTPKAVFAISITNESLAEMTGLGNLDNISKELKSFLTQKSLGSLMTQINGRSGVENLAAASVCIVEKTFVNENVNEDVIYLYTFDNAVPVAVTFIVGEDQAISASGVFVMYDRFTCNSTDEIEFFFNSLTVEVKEVLPEK